MSVNFPSSADHLDCASTPLTGAPLSLSIDFKTTKAQGRRFFSVNHSGQNTDYYSLGLNQQAGWAGELVALTYMSTSVQSTQSSAITDNVWQNGLAAWANSSTRYCWLSGLNKATGTGVLSPAGLNGLCISGRLTDHTSGLGGAAAHACLWSRGTWSDVEALAYGSGFHPRLFQGLLEYWSLFTQAATHVGELTGLTFVASGTTQGADNPIRSTYYKGAAIGAQTWQQNVPITAIPITAGFAQVNAPFTGQMMKVGATTGSTTTTALGSATRVIALTALAGITAGDYVSVGGAAKVPVMWVLGLNICLPTDQTFASGATVARYPVAASMPAGITLGASIGGTPTGTQTIQQDYFVRETTTGNAALFADTNTFSITIAVAAAPPNYSVSPAITQLNVDGYVVGLTPINNCTAYIGAYPAGTSVPSIANLKAGTGALAKTSKAITGTDALTLAGLTLPVADIHVVLNNALGDSAIFSLLNQLKAPPAGSAYRILTNVAIGTPYYGTATIGDIEESLAAVLPSGAALTLRPDGNDAFVAPPVRQMRTARLYNKTTRAWYVDDVGQQTYNIWYNNAPPVFVGLPAPLVFPVGVAASANLALLWQDAEGDTVTVTMLDALPASLTVTNSQIGGQPNANTIGTYRARGTDITGASTDGQFGVLCGQLRAPNEFSLDYHDASANILAAYLNVKIVFQDDEGPPNLVIAQDPLANTFVNPFDTITLYVTRTPAGQTPNYGLRRHSFQCVPRTTNGHLDMKHPLGT